ETEEIATEAAKLVKVTYTVQEHQVVDSDASLSKDKPTLRETGKVAEAFADADSVTISGTYGIPVFTHCCLEPHGQVAEVREGELYLWPSTQNVSGYTDRLSDSVDIPQNKMHVDCQQIGR